MNPYGILSLTLQPKEMLRISDAVTVAAINYYELGENYQRQNQTAKALIFFCKSFQLKRKFYERFDNDDLRRTFSKIIETSISTEEIEKHIYSKKKSLLDGDRIMAYFHSNSAWRAYKEQNYSLAKKLFTEALDFYQGLPGNVDNRQAAMQYLQEIDNKLQVPLKKRMYFILAFQTLYLQQIPQYLFKLYYNLLAHGIFCPKGISARQWIRVGFNVYKFTQRNV
ncbi:unnamed protein product [Rotaria socialis]